MGRQNRRQRNGKFQGYVGSGKARIYLGAYDTMAEADSVVQEYRLAHFSPLVAN
jgi:ribosomal protein S24E